MSLDILDIIQFWRKRVIDINGDEFPVRFALVEKSHCSKDLDLFDLPWIADFLADFADVNGIVVAFCFGLGVH